MDGRKARSIKTRQAIVQATIALLEGGDLKPTAAAVAERAHLSVRSIFQHFSDLEDLFLAVSDAQANRVAELFANSRYEGDLVSRLDAFARYRATLYETVTQIRRAAMLQEPFSPVVAGRMELARSLHRIDVLRAFEPELDAARSRGDATLYDALCSAASFPLWDDLRRYQGLSVEDAIVVYRRTLAALLADAAGA